MLSRALHKYEPPPAAKREKATSLPPALATTTIDSMLKTGSHGSQKFLAGFTNYPNSTSTSRSNFSKPTLLNKPVPMGRQISGVKRTSSQMSGIAAALNSADAFQDRNSLIDLTQDNDERLRKQNPVPKNVVFDFDPNDFEDDSDLDLDVEYPQPLPALHTTREPLASVPVNSSQTFIAELPSQNDQSQAQPPTSSAQTWSSSPFSHKLTPPGAMCRLREENAPRAPSELMSSEPSIEANPRPAKRRSVPWLQQRAEIQDAAKGGESHGEGKSERHKLHEDFTPLPKNKSYPWNTTASAVKEQQKAFKNQQKKAAKNSIFSSEDMQEVVTRNHEVKPSPILLSEEQEKVLNLVVQKKKSVFFTGSAGTGKSVLMRSIITELRKMYAREPDRVAVTASTGLAACNIGGVTLHSFGGIGLGKESAAELVKKISRNIKAKNRWIRTKVLIIDEISMVDGDLFDKLESIARIIRKNGRTFGGIQLVVTGDFFQLPPVPDSNTGRAVKFAFDAGTWSTSVNHTIGLTEVFRQKDPVFANMLNEMRLGKITDETVKSFRKLERPITYEDSLDATELFPTRHEVENANAFKMRDLVGKEYQFRAEDSGSIRDIPRRDKLLSNCMAPQLLTLKKGAQVMLIKNMDDQLVNGLLGIVHAFMGEKTFELYGHDSDIFEADRDGTEELDDNARQARNKLKSMINKDLVADTGRVYPVVRFTISDGTTRDLLCQPEEWKVELPNGDVEAQRKQVPLILAWALSIHKAQGQTLQRVTVDLRKVFEKGQAYVALSRATCREGLQVKGFDKRKVMAHPRVGEFYNSLYSVNPATKRQKDAKKETAENDRDLKDDFTEGRKHRSAQYGFDDDEEEAMAAWG